MKKINIIGSGIGGMASAIRLAAIGYQVTVFEKNNYPGGKLSEIKLGPYRFDKGPSLFTMPILVDELTELAGLKKETFKYTKLQTITHYFYEDGIRVIAKSSVKEFSEEIHQKLGEDKKSISKFLKKSAFYYNNVSELFLTQSLHQLKNFLNLRTLKGLIISPFLNLFSTMHGINAGRFKNSKTVQIFDRYATYNGSSPYKAPALLNLIPHLEFNTGAYLPEKGMYQITEHLYMLAQHLGVKFKFDHKVGKICLDAERVIGLECEGIFFPSDLVLSDMDIHPLYNQLLPKKYKPEKILRQEKSSSAYVFYWAIKKSFNELDLHNIFFSSNYKQEFTFLFENNEPYDDPTVYVNITSKLIKSDAPEGCENWFVMVNVPHNKSGGKISYAAKIRKAVIDKINRVLDTNIETHIEHEAILDPESIQLETSSIGGSLYGNASNNPYAAFLRHSNFSSQLKGLFFVGGSVHPGGGIPLCLLGAKIVADLIKQKDAN